MNEYRAMVTRAAWLRDGKPIFNGSYDHAQVLVENLFEHAHESFDILTGELNPRVFGATKVLGQAENYLALKGTKIRVLVQEPDSIDYVDNTFIKKFGEKDDVEFRQIVPGIAEEIGYHFIVMDKDSYRFEGDINSENAIAAFGDKKNADHLSEIFEKIWSKHSQGLDIAEAKKQVQKDKLVEN